TMTVRLNDRRGFALEASLILLVLVAALIAAAVMGAAMVQRAGGADYRGSRVNYAAEAGADGVMAQLQNDMSDGLITNAELAAITAPTLPGFTLSTNAVRVGAPTPRTITSGPYAGLIGLNQQIDITVHAADATGNRSDAIVSVNAQSIPLFQFGVFYEQDLEIHNGPPMTFAGWVHTNGNLYLTSNATYFQDIITTPGNVYWQRKNQNQRLNGVYINNASGVPVALDFDSRSDPTPAAFSAKSQSHFDGRLMTGVMGVTPLRLPLPTGMPAIQLIQPRTAGDPPAVQNVKMAWKADYHIVVDAAQLANVCAPGAMTVLPRAAVPSNVGGPPSDCDRIFQGHPNAFVDGREDIGVDMLDINVGELESWINADPVNRAVSIMYITFTNVSGNTQRDYPAIRLYNGRQMLYPLTLATDRPLYIKGNFNDIGWQPVSFLGDAITFLSNGWSDAAHSSYTVTNSSGQMWVYAAIAAGHSATPCDWQDPTCTPSAPPPLVPSTGNYGGGLENWSGIDMHYRGSLVSLFQSQYAALHRWQW
ncbi:MAG TPA: hypothetical protein VNH46_02980, partial [Gemmatimonadales bacterium]|nr:hypothetical protein [Gemmatimonadales bacterium]